MIRRPTEEEFKIIVEEMTRLGMKGPLSIISYNNVYINGATVFQVNEMPTGKTFTYAEDDLNDMAGNPYIFDYEYENYHGVVGNGTRMIAVYIGKAHILLPADGQSYVIYGASYAGGEFTIDLGKSIKLPTPLMLMIPRENPRKISPSESEAVKAAFDKYCKFKASKAVGYVALCLLWIILVGLIVIFLGASRDEPDLIFKITVISGPIVMIAGSVSSIIFLNRRFKQLYRRFHYMQPAMMVGFERPINAGTATIGYYLWENDMPVYHHHIVGYGVIAMDNNVTYGDLIYILTPDNVKRSDARFRGGFAVLEKNITSKQEE